MMVKIAGLVGPSTVYGSILDPVGFVPLKVHNYKDLSMNKKLFFRC